MSAIEAGCQSCSLLFGVIESAGDHIKDRSRYMDLKKLLKRLKEKKEPDQDGHYEGAELVQLEVGFWSRKEYNFLGRQKSMLEWNDQGKLTFMQNMVSQKWNIGAKSIDLV